MTLTPFLATMLFIAAVVAGYQYRKVWKREGPAWQAWVYGTLAGGLLLIVAIVPLDTN